MGTGKTTVIAEASDLLKARGIVHAAIDLDALGIAQLPDGAAEDLAYANLASLWGNYAAAGVPRLLLAAAVEDRTMLDRIRRAVPASEVFVCRLMATRATMERRVRQREPGMLQQELVARALELASLLDRTSPHDLALDNDDDASVSEVAAELLRRAGWL